MDVLAGRVLLRPRDLERTQAFYRDVLGLAVHREFGDPAAPGLVFYLGGGFLEVSGRGPGSAESATSLWLQVRDVDVEHARLTDLAAEITREPRLEPWGLREMWLRDPDGVPIVLVQVPADHPMRRDSRHPDQLLS